jgi:hypothetical protein
MDWHTLLLAAIPAMPGILREVRRLIRDLRTK